jgi:hypothetical protein
LSNAAVIIAGSMAAVAILCTIYHCFQRKYNAIIKSKHPITITTNMPQTVTKENMFSGYFLKRTDGKDTWYVDTKTMESTWNLPAGGKVVVESI